LPTRRRSRHEAVVTDDRRSNTRTVGDDGRSVLTTTDPTDELTSADALALAEQAEAEAAEAAARAAAARVRANRLRRHVAKPDAAANAGDAGGDSVITTVEQTEPADESDTDPADETATAEETERKAARARRRLRRPRLRTIVSALALVLVAALLTATGYMVWQHHNATEQRQRGADFASAAREGVITLMSLDFNKAKEGVQRIVDDSTGSFKTDFEAQADTMVKAVQDSKVVATASVSAVAVQSMTNDSAVVLLAAKSEVTNSTGANKEPRMWRLSVTVARDGSQLKLSRVEFVP
jgi:Mce-associated membrane protein